MFYTLFCYIQWTHNRFFVFWMESPVSRKVTCWWHLYESLNVQPSGWDELWPLCHFHSRLLFNFPSRRNFIIRALLWNFMSSRDCSRCHPSLGLAYCSRNLGRYYIFTKLTFLFYKIKLCFRRIFIKGCCRLLVIVVIQFITFNTYVL